MKKTIVSFLLIAGTWGMASAQTKIDTTKKEVVAPEQKKNSVVLELSLDQLNWVWTALNKYPAPFEVSNPIMQILSAQINSQLYPAPKQEITKELPKTNKNK